MKKTYLKILTTCLPWLLLSHTALADSSGNHPSPKSMIVITAADRPLQNQSYAQQIIQKAQGRFAVYFLNSVNDFEAKISQDLPPNETEAKQLFQQRLAELGKDTFKKQLLDAYQALLTATQYQIIRYPAIIFDHQFVIYGVTDLKQALQQYRQWKRRQTGATSKQGVTP